MAPSEGKGMVVDGNVFWHWPWDEWAVCIRRPSPPTPAD